jgi:chemotaxis protein MotB
MARKRHHEEHENHERWLVSYADFITLLFAFFVVMYSVSSVNDGKYRVLSDTLTDAFLTSAESLEPIQVAGEHATPERPEPEQSILPIEQPVPEPLPPQETQPAEKPVSLEQVVNDLKSKLQPFINKDLVNVTQTDKGIEVEMKSKMLFESGSARLSREAMTALRDVAGILAPIPQEIEVEGHTDNVPIQTIAFPSNWELSAARAASVVHLLTRLGVDSHRLAAIGYGEFRPVASNDTEEGRQKNRRVALIILTAPKNREVKDARSFGGAAR